MKPWRYLLVVAILVPTNSFLRVKCSEKRLPPRYAIRREKECLVLNADMLLPVGLWIAQLRINLLTAV